MLRQPPFGNFSDNEQHYDLQDCNTKDSSSGTNIVLDGQDLRDGLTRLVVALTKVLLDVVEKQAARRVTSGSLNPSQIERLGRSLMQVRKRFQQMCETLGLSPSELELPLSQETLNATDAAKPLLQISNPSSLGPAFSSSVGLTTDAIVNVIDRLIEKRTTIAGDITISLAGVELVVLHLLATLEPVGLAKSLPRSGQSYREAAKSSRGIGEMLQSE